MLRNGMFSVVFVTFYLTVCVGLMQYKPSSPFSRGMLFLVPVLVCWMVYTVYNYIKVGDVELSNKPGEKDDIGML